MDTSVALVQAYLHVNGNSQLPNTLCWRPIAATTHERSRTWTSSPYASQAQAMMWSRGDARSRWVSALRIQFFAARLTDRT